MPAGALSFATSQRLSGFATRDWNRFSASTFAAVGEQRGPAPNPWSVRNVRRSEAFMTYLTAAPFWLSLPVLVLVPTLLSMAGPLLIRRVVPLEALSTNNEVAGFKFAVVGVLYAVLLAFAVIVVWERFSQSEALVADE